MPRTARLIVPGYPHHILQRGHNRQTVFVSEEDCLYYLDTLQEWKEKLGCKVYAYCLMTNHTHLIVDPGNDERNLALLMKRLAGRQTRYVNKLEQRSGSLWEGRYKSSPISTDDYLLACCRYVELNPVRAGIVSDPLDYRWSSYSSKVGVHLQTWLDDGPSYLALANSPEQRIVRYVEWVMKEAIPESEWELISTSLQREQLTGRTRFVDEVAQKIGRRVELRGPGRPPKNFRKRK